MDFIWFFGATDEFENARKVRRTVFVEEQGYSLVGEFDETDNQSWHVIGFENRIPLCTARLYSFEEGVYHIGRVAVLSSQRGKGLGLEIMSEITKKAKQLGAKKLELNAQADKYYFYERSGFSSTGKELLDEGQPHLEMIYNI